MTIPDVDFLQDTGFLPMLIATVTTFRRGFQYLLLFSTAGRYIRQNVREQSDMEILHAWASCGVLTISIWHWYVTVIF